MVEGGVRFVKDALFPYFCPDCHQEGEWWCKECRKNSYIIQKIRAGNDLEFVTALFRYEEAAPVGKLIHDFKYNFMVDIGKLWEDIFTEISLPFSNTLLVPVPLFKRRERERGYNQAEVIAQALADHFLLSMDPRLLKRVRSTRQQAKLNAKERKHNVEGAFEWCGKKTIPEHVTLVDDVFTTGATMKECAKVLRWAGIKHVDGFVLAHG